MSYSYNIYLVDISTRREFLEPGAPCEINIDGKTMEKVQSGLRATPTTRFTFDSAAEHIYMLLLKKDCYPRFIRSEHYKALLATGVQPQHKKRFFNFSVPKKKSSTSAPSAGGIAGSGPSGLLSGSAASASGGHGVAVGVMGSLGRRRGSDRSLSGSAHELAVSGVRDGSGGGGGGAGSAAGVSGLSSGAGSKVPQSHSQSNLSDMPYR